MDIKVAIASDHDSTSSLVSGNGSKAPYYIIFENKQYLKTIKNPFVFNSGKAGVDISLMLLAEGVNIVIAGNFERIMREYFIENNIEFYEIADLTVVEALGTVF